MHTIEQGGIKTNIRIHECAFDKPHHSNSKQLCKASKNKLNYKGNSIIPLHKKIKTLFIHCYQIGTRNQDYLYWKKIITLKGKTKSNNGPDLNVVRFYRLKREGQRKKGKGRKMKGEGVKNKKTLISCKK